MESHLTEILIALAKNRVQFIVAGGVAAVLHGVERVTMDLDIAICFTDESVDGFINALKDLHMKPRVPVDPSILKDPDARRQIVEQKHAVVISFVDPDDPVKYIDVFLRDNLSYDRLVGHTVDVSISGYNVRVVSAEKLIEIKQAVHPLRDKDRFDINQLTKLLNERAD